MNDVFLFCMHGWETRKSDMHTNCRLYLSSCEINHFKCDLVVFRRKCFFKQMIWRQKYHTEWNWNGWNCSTMAFFCPKFPGWRSLQSMRLHELQHTCPVLPENLEVHDQGRFHFPPAHGNWSLTYFRAGQELKTIAAVYHIWNLPEVATDRKPLLPLASPCWCHFAAGCESGRFFLSLVLPGRKPGSCKDKNFPKGQNDYCESIAKSEQSCCCGYLCIRELWTPRYWYPRSLPNHWID